MIFFVASFFGGFEYPAEGEGHSSFVFDFDWDLVVGSSDAAGFDFDFGSDCLEGFFKGFEWVFAFFFDEFKGVVYVGLSNGFFAVFHDVVDQFGDQDVVV